MALVVSSIVFMLSTRFKATSFLDNVRNVGKGLHKILSAVCVAIYSRANIRLPLLFVAPGSLHALPVAALSFLFSTYH